MQVTNIANIYKPIDPVRRRDQGQDSNGALRHTEFRRVLLERLANDNPPLPVGVSVLSDRQAVTRSVPQGNTLKGQYLDLFT